MPPVVQIPPGVDTSRFVPLDSSKRDDVRRKLGLNPDALLVSSYSRLVPRKGMDTLIRASAKLQVNIPTLQVAIGGSGRDRERLEKLAKKLNAPVVFLGRVSDDDLSPWLGASDLMVMDCRSRWLGLEQEGFGIVFVEAAASGVAQIAGRSGGSHEAVLDGVTGTVVAKSRSARALGVAMGELLLDNEQRSHFAAQARLMSEERFDWNALALRLGNGLQPFDSINTSV